MIPLIRVFVFAALLFVLTATRASADLTITLTDAAIAPGGTAVVDIYVSSPTSFTLSDFSLGLQLMPVGTPTSLFQFSTTQPTVPFNDSGYVFAGQSFDQDSMPPSPFWSGPFTTTYVNDSITGGDTADPNQGAGYVTIAASTSAYLGEVLVTAPMGATPGDTFQMTVIDNGLTEFDDMNGNPLTIDYTATSGGIVTVASSMVPEPASLVLALTGATIVLGARRARRLVKTRGRTRFVV